MSNIAEGFESQTQALFIKYLGIAKASAGEVRSQLYVASDLGYLSPEDRENTKDLAEKVSRQIYGFVKYLQSQPNPKRI
jgi:four helix bundle protein